MNTTLSPLVLSFPGNEQLADTLAGALLGERSALALHQFPDGETRVGVSRPVAGRDVVLACTLDHPNDKLVTLYLAASNLRELGARRVVLVAPYLPYMRQDKRFHPGEGVSASYIANWLSGFLDGLVTVDPHLHRIHHLNQIYRIPTRVVHAAEPLGRWIRARVAHPVVIGPDAESRQWVSEVAATVSCPYFVLNKIRHGDRNVEVRLGDVTQFLQCTPVLVDDIVSSGHTMMAAMEQLRAHGFSPAVCVGVHALLSQDTADQLRQQGAQAVVTCNTVRHASNVIDLHRPLAAAAADLLGLQLAPDLAGDDL